MYSIKILEYALGISRELFATHWIFLARNWSRRQACSGTFCTLKKECFPPERFVHVGKYFGGYFLVDHPNVEHYSHDSAKQSWQGCLRGRDVDHDLNILQHSQLVYITIYICHCHSRARNTLLNTIQYVPDNPVALLLQRTMTLSLLIMCKYRKYNSTCVNWSNHL